MGREPADINGAGTAKLERWSAGGQDLVRWQYATLEASIALIMSDADVNLAAFQNGGLFATKGLGQFHMHIGKTFGISRQKRGQDAFDRVRRGGNLQHPPVSTLEHLHPLAERIDMGQYTASVSEELLAFGGQDEAAPDAVEQPKPQLLLEVHDLPRKSRLRDAQPQRRFRNRAQFRHGDERSQAPQVHNLEIYAPSALDTRIIMHWTSALIPGISSAQHRSMGAGADAIRA